MVLECKCEKDCNEDYEMNAKSSIDYPGRKKIGIIILIIFCIIIIIKQIKKYNKWHTEHINHG